MSSLFKPLDPNEFVQASVRNLPPVPKGESVYRLDSVRSGIPFRNGEWELMFEHTGDALKEVVLVSHITGQRLLVSLSSMNPTLQDWVLTDMYPTDKLIFNVDRNGKIVWTEFGPNQYSTKEVFVNMGYGIMFRMDFFLTREMTVIDIFLDHQLGAIPKTDGQRAQVQADWLDIQKRVRALMGIERPTIYNEHPNQRITPVGLDE